jgi:indole-3-glycerol phosphate synthase
VTLGGTNAWPARRFSQAISGGEGISVIPLVRGDIGQQTRSAEAAGAEALALETLETLREARAVTTLPLMLREEIADLEALRAARGEGADVCVVVFENLADADTLLDDLLVEAEHLGIDIALVVHDEEELSRALEQLDPEIVLLSERDRDRDELDLEVTLDLLPDVPAGKLVVSDASVTSREQVLELERAGVDAVLVVALDAGAAFPAHLAELLG